ncbi:hypothetical protein COW64_18745 [bacterium (Candidatus Blackallbacteria) CG18_big_fil_WC_8_21_14_2_50_49_26]|nr:MAG: hypothetical protein COW64_18745 [bacterium (Candidatus Blackallbacteria) CG18_big_fil_WC_8_21_14_2_50_49_26]
MFLAASQIAAQQYLLRMIPRGYWYWLSGTCSTPDELKKRAEKYAEFYGTNLSPSKRAYRKSKGLASALMVACPLPTEVMEDGYQWFLIATDGDGVIRDNTKLKDARVNAGRIKWGEDYVLYEAARPREHGGGTHWSWFFQPQKQKELDFYIGKLLKQSPEELPNFFAAQLRRPMHSGIRSFMTRLHRRAHQNHVKMYPNREWTGRDPLKPLPILNSYRKSTQSTV